MDEGRPWRIPDRGRRRGARSADLFESLRLRGRASQAGGVHDLPLPLRPGLVEHPGGVHGVVGHSHPLPLASRSRGWHWSRRTSRWPAATPTTSSCSPNSTTSSRTGMSTRRTASTSDDCSGGRLELMGGTYNEPNTNLTSADSTIRNAIYGVGYQRDVLGGTPATAWQLDAFGHDPQFPGIMSDAWITSSSWARGPFHEWGPTGYAGQPACRSREMAAGDVPRMQFPTEFDWVAPAAWRCSRVSRPTTTRPAGGWNRRPPWSGPKQRSTAVHRAGDDGRDEERPLPRRHGLLAAEPVADPDPARLEQPLRLAAVPHAMPREFFDAVREERKSRRGSRRRARHEPRLHRQGRLVHRHQAGAAVAENTLLTAEKFGTIASLLGARSPSEVDRQGMAAAALRGPPRRNHGLRIGPGLPRPHGRLARGRGARPECARRCARPSRRADGTSGDGPAMTVFNRCRGRGRTLPNFSVDVPLRREGLEVGAEGGGKVPILVEAIGEREGGRTGDHRVHRQRCPGARATGPIASSEMTPPAARRNGLASGDGGR